MILYNNFFRAFVLRKKADVSNPKFFMLGEMELPRDSLIVFPPNHPESKGPTNAEPLISNYPNQINIAFNNHYVIKAGKARPLPFNERKLINDYRDTHYNYKWARNPDNVVTRKQELFVGNIAMGHLKYRYVLDRFTAFNQSYNQLYSTIDVINEYADKYRDRHIFLRMELPPSLPSYLKLNAEQKYYLKAFDEDGNITTMNDQGIRTLKEYGAFWYWDWFLFLMGDMKHSQFGRLTDNSLAKLHIVFTFNGSSFIIKPGILKDWLDETKKGDEILTPMRINVVKRLLLMFVTMIKSQETLTAKLSDNNEEEIELDDGVAGTSTDERRESRTGGTIAEIEEAIPDMADLSDSSALDDILRGNKSSVQEPDDVGPREEDATDNGAVEESWGSEVSDELFEEPEVEDIVRVEQKRDITPLTGIEKALAERAKSGSLTLGEQRFFTKAGEKYKEIEMPGGETLEEFVKIDPAVLKEVDEIIAPEIVGLDDESMRESRVMNFKNNYNDKLLNKDIASMFLGVQKAGIALTNVKVDIVENISGSFAVWTPTYHPVDGSPSTRPIRIPTLNKDGSYRVDGQNRVKAAQRMDLPIRKLDAYRVGLSSYFGTKLIVSRNRMVANDRALKMSTQIKAKGNKPNGNMRYVVGNTFNPVFKLPRPFTSLQRFFRKIEVDDIVFDLDIDQRMKEDKAFAKANSEKSVICGTYKGTPLVMDEFGNLKCQSLDLGTVEDVLWLDQEKLPLDFAQINVRGFQFPMGVVLGYYYGIDKLIETLKLTTRSIPMGERPVLDKDEFYLKFADEYLVFNARDPMACLVFGGMRKLDAMANFNRYDLNSTGVWVPLMNNPRVKPGHFKEMKLLLDMFIDPITGKELIRMGYSDQFDELLIQATKLLLTDQHRHEVEIEEQRLIGYEMFAGIVYMEQVKAVRHFRNKPADKRNTVDMNPEAVLAAIVKDTATDIRQDVNPIHEVKDQESLTFGGTLGRSDVSMVRRTRGQLPSYAGIISEAGKDSGKVGYVGFLTSNPKIADLRGNIDPTIKNGEAGIGSVSMNLMYGATIDDPKRQLFSGVQHSQGTSAVNYVPNIVTTGYDRVISHRTSELYSKVAKQDGKVTKVTKQALVITYADGTEDSYPLGLTLGKAAGEVHRHTRVTDLVVGDTFKKGEVVGWDDVYFQRDLPFNPRQVVWKCGIMARVALLENQFTFEDSLMISSKFAKASKTSYTKEKTFFVAFQDTIELKVRRGTEVDSDSILCNVVDASLADVEDFNTENAGVERLGIKQIKSNHFGKVVEFEVEYNGDPALMSESLRAFVTATDKEISNLGKLTGSSVKNGNVAGNLNYGRAPIDPGSVKITVYVEEYIETAFADKWVLGNQMKGTTGYINQKSYRTADGREIDVVFSLKGLFNRMVLSLRDKLIAGELSRHVKNEFIRIYRGA